MACSNPITAYQCASGGVVFTPRKRDGETREIKLQCGMCQACRLKRRGDWELRITHESNCWEANSFLTLTYDDENLPADGSLHYPHVQGFLKRVRYHRGLLAHYTCGEYGEHTSRPHYHMCMFGQDFTNRKPEGKSESGELYYSDPELTKLWGHGFATVQNLTPQSAAYAAGYIMKKLLGPDAKQYEYAGLAPEFAHMSNKRPIGKMWAEKYLSDFYPNDYAIQRGKKRTPPRYYDQLLKETNPEQLKLIKEDRELRAGENWRDNTADRLKVKATVLNAQLHNQRRNGL